jgi:hypothetical protein
MPLLGEINSRWLCGKGSRQDETQVALNGQDHISLTFSLRLNVEAELVLIVCGCFRSRLRHRCDIGDMLALFFQYTVPYDETHLSDQGKLLCSDRFTSRLARGHFSLCGVGRSLEDCCILLRFLCDWQL